VEVYRHAFLTSVLDVGEWSASCSGSFTSEKERPVHREEESGWVTQTFWTIWKGEIPLPTLGVDLRFLRSSNPWPGHCTHLAKPSNKHTAEVVNRIVEWLWNLLAERSWHYVTAQFLSTVHGMCRRGNTDVLLRQRLPLANWSQTPSSNVMGGDCTYTRMRHVQAVNTTIRVRTAGGALSNVINNKLSLILIKYLVFCCVP
jgi:hypothetical protein